MKPGDLFFHEVKLNHNDSPTLCLVLSTHAESHEGELERFVRYLHPTAGILERSYIFFNGETYIGMRKVTLVQSSPLPC
jgi:hypothetical protein